MSTYISCSARSRLVGMVLPLLFLMPAIYAQQLVYSDMWAQDNGDGTVTIWGSGTTDDTPAHGWLHYAGVTTDLRGPNGWPISGQSVFGYASILVSLPGVAGDYRTSSNHDVSCYGSLGGTFTEIGTVGTPILSYSLSYVIVGTDQIIGVYYRCNPGTRCNPPSGVRVSDQNFRPPHNPQFIGIEWLTWTFLGGTSCFRKNLAEYTSCLADSPPGYP
jgi:hypothetical protein